MITLYQYLGSEDAFRTHDGVASILQIYADATPWEREDGLDWYPRAHRFCAKLAGATGHKIETVAAVVARLSPQCPWDANRKAASAILTGRVPDGANVYGNNVALAEKIRDEQDVSYTLPAPGKPRPKIAPFYRCILHPTTPQGACVDTWATRVWLGDCMAPATTITALQSRMIATDYDHAAWRAGLLPQEMQAITWIAAHRLAREASGVLPFGMDWNWKI